MYIVDRALCVHHKCDLLNGTSVLRGTIQSIMATVMSIALLFDESHWKKSDDGQFQSVILYCWKSIVVLNNELKCKKITCDTEAE